MLSHQNNSFLLLLQRLNLTNIILSATNFTSNIGTCIDLILTNNKNLVVKNDVTPPFCSSHSVIIVEIKFNTFKQHAYKRVITGYSKADYVNLRKDLQDTNWDNKVFYISKYQWNLIQLPWYFKK